MLNKTDLVSGAHVADLDAWLSHVAPGVPVLHARGGEVPWVALSGLAASAPSDDSTAHHGDDYVTVHVTIDRPVPRAGLERLLDALPDGVLRVKGVLRLEESPDKRSVVHRVASRRSITSGLDWPDGEAGRIVLIALAGTPGLADPTDLVNHLFA